MGVRNLLFFYLFFCGEFVWFSGFVYYEQRGKMNGIKAHLATNLLSHILPFVEITEKYIKKIFVYTNFFLFVCFCLTSDFNSTVYEYILLLLLLWCFFSEYEYILQIRVHFTLEIVV